MTATEVPSLPPLPDLDAYRRQFLGEGLAWPIPSVPHPPGGLLAALPAPPRGRRGWPWDVQTAPSAETGAEWPRITLVTPSFQQGAFLEETLRSVLLQNYPRLEYIVMDGGSADASPEIVEHYRPWLSFSRAARDRGQAHAINLGFSLAGGDLYGFLNSDDFLLPGALRRVAQAWRDGGRLIYGDSLYLLEPEGRRGHILSALAHPRYRKFPGLLPSHAAYWPAARHQPMAEDLHCAVDYELWIRLLPGSALRHVAWPLAVLRAHAAAKSSDPAMKQRWAEDASRNGRAHPGLFRPRPWLDREFGLVQRIARSWRRRGEAARLEAVRRECGWTEPIAPAD